MSKKIADKPLHERLSKDFERRLRAATALSRKPLPYDYPFLSENYLDTVAIEKLINADSESPFGVMLSATSCAEEDAIMLFLDREDHLRIVHEFPHCVQAERSLRWLQRNTVKGPRTFVG